MITLSIATDSDRRWANDQVCAYHYLRRPVDARCSVLTYVVLLDGDRVGCLMYGRPESTACYSGQLTYGSPDDVLSGRAQFSRWELLNLARVWLDPVVQRGGDRYVHSAASQAIALSMKRVVYDYLTKYHPVNLAQPWQIRRIISYCDTRHHTGTIYRATGFSLARTNERGIQTWIRAARSLRTHEQQQIEKLSDQSVRSRRYRALQQSSVIQQMSMAL